MKSEDMTFEELDDKIRLLGITLGTFCSFHEEENGFSYEDVEFYDGNTYGAVLVDIFDGVISFYDENMNPVGTHKLLGFLNKVGQGGTEDVGDSEMVAAEDPLADI